MPVTNRQFTVKTKAFYDAHMHILKCTVMEVIEPGNGRIVGSGKLKIRVDQENGPYTKGEIMEVDGYHTYPRVMTIKKQYSTNINPNYEWIK
ncbi:MAG: hypothetical protein JKY66_11260 [Spongiibacteraceae bacterium]|nr:hypothetical protein [Spongiibacteraceae bacterium]